MQHKVEQIKKNSTNAIVSTLDKEGKKKDFDCDVVLVSVGRKPNTIGLNLDKVNIDLDKKNRIPKVIAVSKTFPLRYILPLIEHGHQHFGENKVQEAFSKWQEIKKENQNLKSVSYTHLRAHET